MAVYRSLKTMGEAMERRLQKNGKTQEEAFKEMVDRSYVDHIELLSGHLSPQQTRGAFAKLGSGARRLLTQRQIKNRNLKKTGAPLLPINIQTAYLLERLKKKGPDARGVIRITDDAPYARIQMGDDGSKVQIGRGFSREIDKRWKLYLSVHARVLRARLK